MLDEISLAKFNEWREFEQLEPFEEERGDWRTAHLVATVANLTRGKDDEVRRIEEFVLPFGDRRPYEKPAPATSDPMMTVKQAYLVYVDDVPED